MYRTSLRTTIGLVRLTRVYPNLKIKKGNLFKCVITNVRLKQQRLSGFTLNSDFNGVILLKKDHTPVATRIYKGVFLELRYFGFARVCSLSVSVN